MYPDAGQLQTVAHTSSQATEQVKEQRLSSVGLRLGLCDSKQHFFRFWGVDNPELWSNLKTLVGSFFLLSVFSLMTVSVKMIGFRKQWKQQWVATWVAAKDQLHGRGKVCRAPTAKVYHSSLCNSSEVCSPPFELKDGLPSRRTAATKCLLMKFWLCKKPSKKVRLFLDDT